MQKIWAAIIVLSIIPISWTLMLKGWNKRKKRQNFFTTPKDIPKNLQTKTNTYECEYIVTTIASQILERINVHKLGIKSKLNLAIYAEGIIFFRPNAQNFFIPTTDFQTAHTSSGAIGKFVEKNGLIVVSWFLEKKITENGKETSTKQLVETSFRPRFRAENKKILEQLKALENISLGKK